MHFRRGALAFVLSASVVASCIVAGITSETNVAHAADGTITGVVFQDYNSNGANDTAVAFGQATDIGIAGIEVKGYDSTGALVGFTTSGADGSYALNVTGSATSELRVEFSIPASNPLSAFRSSFSGINSGTSVQFTEVGAANVNFGINVPGEFCQNQPKIGVVRLCHAGDTFNLNSEVQASPTLFIANYDSGPYNTSAASPLNTNGVTSWATNGKATEAQTGSLLGLAYDNRPGVNRYYASAFVRRHTRMYEQNGSPVPGALFAMTSSGTSFLVDLEALASGDQFSNSTSGQFGHVPSNAARHIVNPQDILYNTGAVAKDSGVDGVFEEVGAAGIGDIDMDEDGNLYVVSLYTKHLYQVPMPADGSAPTSIVDLGDITAPLACVNGDARPFGLQPWRGLIYLGVTCDGSGDVGLADPDVNITANIVTIDPSAAGATFSAWITGIPLGAVGNVDTKGPSATGGTPQSSRWWPWLDTYSDSVFVDSVSTRVIRPVPMFSDLEFDSDGSLILSFRDRTGDQMSPEDGKDDPDGTQSTQSFASGDILRLCRTGAGYSQSDYVLAGPTVAGCLTNGTNGGGVAEYYVGDGFMSWHRDTGAGFSEQVPGFGNVLMTMYDPWDDGATADDRTFASGGVSYLKNSDGSKDTSVNAGGGVQYYTKNAGNGFAGASGGSFKKVNGMADIEAACDQAPVQIGNRVWIDSDRDGVQDPGETPVAGVTVRLYDATGTTLLGTAITNAAGEYYFASNVTEVAAGDNDHVGGGLSAGSAFVVRFDNPADYAPGGPLDGYSLTLQDSTDPVTSLDNSVDSDAAEVSSYPQITTSTIRPGVNDHTYDVGFNKPSVSVGDYVWWDSDKDGIQDAGEQGIAGVTLTLTNVDGTPVVDVNGRPVTTTTTDANGRYSFDNLPLGQYKVTVTPPGGYRATTANSGSDTGVDSSTGSATSRNMTVNGDRDPTLDFGFYPEETSGSSSAASGPTVKVSVGDYVWFDDDRDGIQDPKEDPIAGVVLSITKADGSPVYDVDGKPVTTTTTDANGRYSFDNLPPGQYKVTVTPPAGFTATKGGKGGDVAKDSSTGSATSRNMTVNGDRDPTLDFGFYRPKVKVGNLVWRDKNGDGIQQSTERGLAGAMLTLRTADGKPATDIFGKRVKPIVTKSDGKYVFDNLPLGRYVVKIAYPLGVRPTTADRADLAKNSSSHTARSVNLRRDGQADMTLDFGVVGTPDAVLPPTL